MQFASMTDAEILARRAGDKNLPEVDWVNAKVEFVDPVVKKPISIRLDIDVLEFFQEDGKGYQRRINQVLRSYMEHEKRAG